jgi:hypothetical protein
MGQCMTTDNDEVHGTVIDPGYSSEPESESLREPDGAPDEDDEEVLSPADSSADDDDEEVLSPADSSDEDDEDDEDDDDELIVVESYVPGEDDATDGAGAEADEAPGLDATGDEADEAALPDGPDGTDVMDNEAAAPAPAPAPAHSRMAGDGQFGSGADAGEMYQRWAAIQSGFVDDPRESVTEAAAFLSEVMTALLDRVREREQALRDEWDRDDVDTEGLRVVLRRYRAFLDRLAAL